MLRFVDFQNFIRTEKENCNLSYNFFINFLEINFEIIMIFCPIIFHSCRYYISRVVVIFHGITIIYNGIAVIFHGSFKST
jgi:hypothetical protein